MTLQREGELPNGAAQLSMSYLHGYIDDITGGLVTRARYSGTSRHDRYSILVALAIASEEVWVTH